MATLPVSLPFQLGVSSHIRLRRGLSPGLLGHTLASSECTLHRFNLHHTLGSVASADHTGARKNKKMYKQYERSERTYVT